MLVTDLFEDTINEKVMSLGKDYDDKDVLVWENPSHDELLELLMRFKQLRGFMEPNKNLYVWDAYKNTHHGIEKYIGHMHRGYLFFSTQRSKSYEEWKKYMKRYGNIFVGIKYSEVVGNKEISRASEIENSPMFKKALGI